MLKERQTIFKTFIEKWAYKHVPMSGVNEIFSRIESHFQITLPSNYKYFISEYGAISTQWLLHSIVKSGEYFSDIQEFIDPKNIIESTIIQREGGMPLGYIPFALDCMGNQFLFKESECHAKQCDTTIYFFDHDFISVEKEEDSLLHLLERYNKIDFQKS